MIQFLTFLAETHPQLPELEKLRQWRYFPLLTDEIDTLRRDALHKSRIHGEKHIERTILFGAMLAMGENLPEKETRLLLDACAYHDTGRVSDWFDPTHGARSAEKIPFLTEWRGSELSIVQAAVKAHSLEDEEMDVVLTEYRLAENETAKKVMSLLKDADALDRYRISPEDLDVRQLRSETSRRLLRFAKTLNRLYHVE